MLARDGLTLRNERRDFVEWHRGRAPYVLWALDVELPAVRQRLDAAALHLAGWLLDGYCRQAHITLDLCGFPAEKPADGEEFSLASLAAHCRAAAASFPAPFSIEIGGLASFSSAPFLRVADPENGIALARRALALNGRNVSRNDYLPHVTVGLYADAWPAPAVHDRLALFPHESPIRLPVDHLSLLAYDPREIGGRLTKMADFHLEKRCLIFCGAH